MRHLRLASDAAEVGNRGREIPRHGFLPTVIAMDRFQDHFQGHFQGHFRSHRAKARRAIVASNLQVSVKRLGSSF